MAGFTYFLRPRFSEIDRQGVVFHAHYLTYFDMALTEYLYALGHNYERHRRETNAQFHVARTVVDYKSPIFTDQLVAIRPRVERIGRTSLTFRIEAWPGDGAEAPRPERLIATGEVVWVNTDRETHRPVPLASGLVAMLERGVIDPSRAQRGEVAR